MNIYSYEAAFGAADVTSRAMRKAIGQWYDLYYRQAPDKDADPCQRIAYTVVSKLVRATFGEYKLTAPGPVAGQLARNLDQVKAKALQLALVGGECYLKPCPAETGFSFTLMSRNNVLIFARDSRGEPVDMGTVERSVRGEWFYTLLERRYLDQEGYLVLENKLFRSRSDRALGTQVSLREHPEYALLQERVRFPVQVGLGLVRLVTPMLNCVDGSADGISVYAAAAGLIRAIDRNEAQLSGEFDRGQSRVFLSQDLLRQGQLEDHLFVGLDEDPEQLGVQIFSPQLREQSFLARKQEYLRNVESVIGLKRGMISDANMDDRTATEISASAGEYNLTVMELQQMWHRAVAETFRICGRLGALYGWDMDPEAFSIDWGNGTLYDEEKLWQGYLQMVDKGLLKPEIALGWRFDQPAQTPQEQAAIRAQYMP